MAGTECFGATAQPRNNIPEFCLSTPSRNHTITHFRGTDKTIHKPRIIFSRLTQAKYHQPLYNLQKKAVRIMTFSSFEDLSTPLFRLLAINEAL